MRIVKIFLIIILLIVGIAAALTIASRYFSNPILKKVATSTSQFQPLIASSMEKVGDNNVVENLSSFRSKVLGVQTAAPTASPSGDNANASTQDTSVTQRTFEFARYTYCQEVVKQYEVKH